MVRVGEQRDMVKKSTAWGGNSTCTCLQVRLSNGFVIFVFAQRDMLSAIWAIIDFISILYMQKLGNFLKTYYYILV